MQSSEGVSVQPLIRAELLAEGGWRSWLVVAAVYVGWLALTWFHASIPWPLLFLAGGFVLAWYGSVQHEALHELVVGPRRLNALVAYPPLGLWLPFPVYKRSHLAHHGGAGILTDPRRDPESYYVERARWSDLPGWWQRVLVFNHTLLGRLTIGPFLTIGQFLFAELRALGRGDRGNLTAWLWHIPATALVLAWVMGVCGMPLWLYLLCFVLPGTSLTLIRSFAEHLAHETPDERTAFVEAGPMMSLLFLNNNLHFAHHRRPDLPWYALPRYYRENRSRLLGENGGLLYRGGYLEIAHRFLLRPVDDPAHPFL